MPIGSVRERHPGVWEVRVSIGADPVTGDYRQRSRTVRGTRRQADKRLAQLVAETESERNPGTDATVSVLLERWMQIVWRDRSPTTAYGYERKIARHITPTLGQVPLAKLSASHLDRLYQGLHEAGLAARTVRQIHAIVSAALTQAYKWGWVAENVAQRATPPAVSKHELELPAVATIRALALACAESDPELATMIGVLLKLGCRRGELCGLQWGDVDLERAEVVIRRAVVRRGDTGEVVVKDTKTHAIRPLAIDEATVVALQAHRVAMVDRATWAGVDLGLGSFVFSRLPSCSTPMVPDTVTQAWRRVCRREGVSGVRLHDLRHLNASVLLDAGVATATVSARLGHRDQSTTTNIYGHVVGDADRRAALVAGERL